MLPLFHGSYPLPSLRSEKGQGMVEYGLILVLVALVVFAALALLGPKIVNIFNTVGNSLQ